jgi:hypothetical protein
MHIDDVGRLLDRTRILLTNAIAALADAEHVVPEARDIADDLDRLKERLMRAWECLPEPELPLAS